ncbi:hypothetical protein HN51_007069 [Arachis hypogaea]|uniref:Uncharacterized protein n=1 Tax=Arachis hypogaea TaxID=3818 RepID=A0A445D9K1_ARAHY|nr:uncharacterized protein DS421_5g143080 [Arachis hypogaea]RYR59862.1 hypothetical protein Ahy_A05g025831 isoform A [Arachis hypogaea]
MVVELPEASMCIQSAAQLLVNFSLSSSFNYQNCSSKTECIKVDKEEIVKVQCTDSYEQIALELEECNDDDCSSASSKPYEVDIAKTNDFSLRLKRGRRFKDFQKEILPGLASLSRHEIQDINILEAILRSREYRKIRSRMGDHSSQCAPTTRVRSKRNSAWRKLF